MNYEYLTEEEIKEIEREYGDINNYIKDEVYDNKKETTNFMDKMKYLFFLYLLKGKSKKEFKSKIDEEYEKFKKDIDKNKVKGYKIVSDLTKYQNEGTYTRTSEKFVKMNLNGLLSRYGIELTSTKKEDDKYIRVLEKYYSSTEKTLNKPWVNANEYLSKKVSEFDKVEKTVAYRSKATGNIRAYFDIASYDSMVYNVNLTNTGWKESIKYCIEEGNDIVYIEPHGYSCDLCRPLQGKFYTLSSKPKVYNDMIVQPLEIAIKQGLRHPNCTHIPQPANEFQNVSNKYSEDLWSEKYNAKQKKQALELKKKRLLNDNKVYKELGNEEMIDKNKQKIKKLNEGIKEQKEIMNGY